MIAARPEWRAHALLPCEISSRSFLLLPLLLFCLDPFSPPPEHLPVLVSFSLAFSFLLSFFLACTIRHLSSSARQHRTYTRLDTNYDFVYPYVTHPPVTGSPRKITPFFLILFLTLYAWYLHTSVFINVLRYREHSWTKRSLTQFIAWTIRLLREHPTPFTSTYCTCMFMCTYNM